MAIRSIGTALFSIFRSRTPGPRRLRWEVQPVIREIVERSGQDGGDDNDFEKVKTVCHKHGPFGHERSIFLSLTPGPTILAKLRQLARFSKCALH